ncbi:MAG: hypothetical protein R3194_09885 [Limnobacter sp.]|nr:hypothetical protein [Limnobacter sp.]
MTTSYRLGEWLAYFAQGARQRVNERLLALSDVHFDSAFERFQVLYQTQHEFIVGVEPFLRRAIQTMLPEFLLKHSSLESECRQSLALLGLDAYGLRQFRPRECLGEWESLGFLYTLECANTKITGLVNEWAPNCNLPDAILTHLQTSNSSRWFDFRQALVALESQGISRSQFDMTLEGALLGYDKWELALDNTLEDFDPSRERIETPAVLVPSNS